MFVEHGRVGCADIDRDQPYLSRGGATSSTRVVGERERPQQRPSLHPVVATDSSRFRGTQAIGPMSSVYARGDATTAFRIFLPHFLVYFERTGLDSCYDGMIMVERINSRITSVVGAYR